MRCIPWWIESTSAIYPITMSVAAFSYLVGNGGGPLTSILRGAKDDEGAEKVISNSLTLLVLLGILVPAVCYLVKEPILYLFGATLCWIPFLFLYLVSAFGVQPLPR